MKKYFEVVKVPQVKMKLRKKGQTETFFLAAYLKTEEQIIWGFTSKRSLNAVLKGMLEVCPTMWHRTSKGKWTGNPMDLDWS